MSTEAPWRRQKLSVGSGGREREEGRGGVGALVGGGQKEEGGGAVPAHSDLDVLFFQVSSGGRLEHKALSTAPGGERIDRLR